MRTAALIAGLCLSLNAFAATQTLTCNSSDFDPQNYDGQSLSVTITDGVVTRIAKNQGSWFCDDGKNESPKLLVKTEAKQVYDAQMNCDEYHARLIVHPADLTKMTYVFSYPDDERDRTDNVDLTCK